MSPSDPDQTQLRIGPGVDPTDFRTGSSSELMDEARLKIRCEDEDEIQSSAILHRLVIAFVLILVVGAVFFVVLPRYGMTLSPVMPALAFGAILIGSVLTMPRQEKPKKSCDDDGRPVCCQGPRPLKAFRDDD